MIKTDKYGFRRHISEATEDRPNMGTVDDYIDLLIEKACSEVRDTKKYFCKHCGGELVYSAYDTVFIHIAEHGCNRYFCKDNIHTADYV